MTTDWIGQYEVLLSSNHIDNKFCDILGSLKLKTQEMPWVFFASSEKSHLSVHNGAYCPVT